MEGRLSLIRRSTGGSTAAVPVVLIIKCVLSVMIPQVSSVRYIVGDNRGWSPNVNYTIWAQGKHFYNGDWLFFVYDRNEQNVLEVNKTNFETCNIQHPLQNWTRGAGRDVVPLNVTKTYYFVSGNGFCYKGMKVAIRVENSPSSSPSPSPRENGSYRVEKPEIVPSPSPPESGGSPNVKTTSPSSLPSSLPEKTGGSGGAGNPSPQPSSLSQKSGSPSLMSTMRGQTLIPALFAVTAALAEISPSFCLFSDWF